MTDISQGSFHALWKAALERYFASFMAFFFPEAHAAIDWSRSYALLDTELRQAVRDAEVGPRRADRLVEVHRRGGGRTLVYVHIEIQSQTERGFAERMFVYHYRLHDRYRQPVVSLAVLGDDRPTWKPSSHRHTLWGCTLDFRFPVAKLLDYQPQRASLEGDTNPFATVVLAHLVVQETCHSGGNRARMKFQLTRRLYTLGYDRQEILDLYGFIDWVLTLPQDLERQVWQQIEQFELEGQMSYITSAERIGHERGRVDGLIQGIGTLLKVKYSEASTELMSEIQQINDVSLLERLLEVLISSTTVDEVRAVYTPTDPAP